MTGYHQIEVEDLVNAVGGIDVVRQSEDPWTLLTQAHKDLIQGLCQLYSEVGEVDLTALADFCDNL